MHLIYLGSPGWLTWAGLLLSAALGLAGEVERWLQASPRPLPKDCSTSDWGGPSPKHIWPRRGLDGAWGLCADEETAGLGSPESCCWLKQCTDQLNGLRRSVAFHLFTSTERIRPGERPWGNKPLWNSLGTAGLFYAFLWLSQLHLRLDLQESSVLVSQVCLYRPDWNRWPVAFKCFFHSAF